MVGFISAVTVVTTGTTAAVWALPSPRLIVWTLTCVQYVDRSSPSPQEMALMHPQCHCENGIGLTFGTLSPVFRFTDSYYMLLCSAWHMCGCGMSIVIHLRFGSDIISCRKSIFAQVLLLEDFILVHQLVLYSL